MPLWAMILAAIFLKEPITAKKVLGIAAGASGALLLVLAAEIRTVPEALRRGRPAGPVRAVELRTLLRVVQEFRHPLLAHDHHEMDVHLRHALHPAFTGRDLLSTDWQALSAAAIGSLAFIVVGSTFLSYMLIIVGQKNLRPTVAGMYNYIQPLVATLVAVCWGMETFDPTKICSVLLIFSGVYLVTTSRSRPMRRSPAYSRKTPGNDSRIPHAAYAAPGKRRRSPEISGLPSEICRGDPPGHR